MSSPTSDKDFYTIFGYITLGIIVLAIIIAILSKVFASSISNDAYDEIKVSATEQRLASPEKINLASNPTFKAEVVQVASSKSCLLYTSPSPRDTPQSRMPSSA